MMSISNMPGVSSRSTRSIGAGARVGRFLTISIFLTVLAALIISASSASSSYLFRDAQAGLGPVTGDGNGKTTTRTSSRFNSGLLEAFIPTPFASEQQLTSYAADCSTPKSAFVLGETICARVAGGPDYVRRLALIDSGPYVRDVKPITTDPEFISFTLPSDPTTTIDGQPVDNRGVWKLNVVPAGRFSVVASVSFTVSNPAAPGARLSISKGSDSSGSITAGSNILYTLLVSNPGPDTATNVQVVDAIPADTTFLSGQQDSGPGFSCTFPAANASVGSTTCMGTLMAGQSALFTLVFNINLGTSAGTVISNTGTTSSDTPDSNTSDNSATSNTTVVAGAPANTCTLDCPEPITANANTTEGGFRGAHVDFDAAAATGDCGAVTATPASGSFFLVGTTIVNVSSEFGSGSCSFTVTIEDQGTNPPSITCPSNKTANADSNCQAVVAIGAPTVSGNNVTVSGVRSDGQPLYNCDCFANPADACDVHGACTRKATDAPFASGVTTITWTAYAHDTPGPYATPDDEENHRVGTSSCVQTITVNDVTPPTITASNQTASADANCMAPVPNFSTIATVSDNCACASSDTSQICDSRNDIAISQSPAAGTMVGLGPHTITLSANDGSSNNNGAGNTTTIQVTFTVNDTTAPVITCPANVSANAEPGTCAAHVNPGTATATDNCDSTPTITATRSDSKPLTDTYPVGTTTITWTATDDSGNHSSCAQTVTVVDTQPPVITLNGQTPSMWPPNHKYSTFQVTNFVTGVTDNCGGNIPVSNVVITKVTSDETENGNGDGNTSNDIVIAANCKSVQLRSERDGGGNGRVYTIFFSVTDQYGNVGTATAKVVVQHNPGETAVDSGPHYTVTSACGP